MAVAASFMTGADDNLDWQQKLANYAADPTKGKDEYQRSLKKKQYLQSIGDTTGVQGADKWMGQVNTALGGAAAPSPNDEYRNTLQQVRDRLEKPATPFSYDLNADPQYQAALSSAQTNSQMAAGNIAADLNKRGILNSTITADRSNQAAQAEYGRVSKEVVPALMGQAYQKYRDGLQTDRQQSLDMLNVAQSGADNTYRTDQADEAKKQRNIALAQYLTDAYGVNVDPKSDPGVAFDQVNGLTPLSMQKFQEDNNRFGQEFALKELAQKHNMTMDEAQMAVSRMNAATSRMGAETSASNNSITLSKYKDSKDARKFESQLMGDLSQLTNESDIADFLNMNAGEITDKLGTEGYQQVKQMALAPYQAINKDKASQALHDQEAKQNLKLKAIGFAQGDPYWKNLDDTKRQDLINSYIQLLQTQ